MSGAMVLDGQQAHVHCGGVDYSNGRELSSDCFALRVDSSREVVVDSLAPLPQPRWSACHGSDGNRLALAGGQDDNGDRRRDVLVLESVRSTWGIAAVELPAARESSAGLLLGDRLVCMGGVGEVRRSGGVCGGEWGIVLVWLSLLGKLCLHV